MPPFNKMTSEEATEVVILKLLKVMQLIYLNKSYISIKCPLCMEPLEVDDTSFFPCTCGYQVMNFSFFLLTNKYI
jgi:hypothetical protein